MFIRHLALFLAATSALAAADASQTFAQYCGICHGTDGGGTDRGPKLLENRRMRTRTVADIVRIIRMGTPAGMPPVPLPEDQIEPVATFVRSLNLTAIEAAPPGDAEAGGHLFFNKAACVTCHAVNGRGSTIGPDLSDVGRQLSLKELTDSIVKPSERITPGYDQATVLFKDGTTLKGHARNRGMHDVQLQDLDGKMHLFNETEYARVIFNPASSMPAFTGTPEELRDLIAWLSRQDGRRPTPTNPLPAGPLEFEAIVNAKPGEWPTYNGDLSGNRYSKLDQINQDNVRRLQLQWIYPMQYQPLETTPLVVEGVMYVSGPNQVHALDARTGRDIWRYSRPRSQAGTVSGDAALGANRGTAYSGDRIFFITDNAHMICLNRLTGALLWDVAMSENPSRESGSTSAPLVVNDLVIGGIGGGDGGIRGFIAAFKITTGEPAWRLYTVPKRGEPGAETWKGDAIDVGGAATWLPGSFDPETQTLYWPTGNPFPDTDGTDREGDNLYTDSDLAIDARTGKLKWHFQHTPHDLHDWDSNQPVVLVDAKFHGQDRKLLLHANRNGFFYVLDRLTGEFLLGKPFVKKLTWASGLDAKGRPILTPNNATTLGGVLTAPAVRGATNWFATAYSPKTNLYYVMSIEDSSIYRQAKRGGFFFPDNPADPAKRFLRAIDVETGAIKWEVEQIGPAETSVVAGNYTGVLATAANLVFYGEASGGFAAVDAATGKTLWHFDAGTPQWKASPMTYTVNGRQYVAIAAGANILSFALPNE